MIYGWERPDLGPLTSTFLISMSMPILNIPVERIERQIDRAEDEIYADDRPLNPKSVEAFDNTIRKGKLGDAPFYRAGGWSFHSIKQRPFPNIANGLPDIVADALSTEEAVVAARNMNASQWVSILRNAMAHGGIAYLDQDGRSSHGTPVKMFAFISGKFGKPRCMYDDADCRYGSGKLERLNILRVSESEYLRFLKAWVAWLEEAKIFRKAVA